MRPITFRSPHWSSLPSVEPRQQALRKQPPTVWLVRQPWSSPRDTAQNLRSDSLVLACSIMRQMGLPGAEYLARDPGGRPTLPATSGLDLSISHSGRLWLLALSSGKRRVGVDIEGPRRVPRAIELAERHFPLAEIGMLRRLAPQSRERAFLRLWCAREAILKAHGRGIAFGLSKLSLRLSHNAITLVDCDPELGAAKDWRVREFEPARGTLGVVAWRGPPAVLRGIDTETRAS